MVQFDVESPVKCETCKKPAIRRTANVVFANLGSCKVSFDTHATCIADAKWLAAITRMNLFFEKLYKFMQQFRGLPTEALALECGQILGFDFRTVHPDACTHREKVAISARVRAFGLEEEVEIQPRLLKGIRRDSVLKELRPLAEAAALRLKRRFEEGRF
jgi:hypothetical protein